MSKDSSFLCFCVCGLKLAYADWIHMYAGLFLRMQVYSWDFVYVGMGLRTWGPICVCETPSRGLTLHLFSSISTISLLFAILIPFFVIFSFEHPYILLFIFILVLKISFYLLLSHPNPLIQWWSGTIFFFLKSGPLSGKRALSLSLAFFWKGP